MQAGLGTLALALAAMWVPRVWSDAPEAIERRDTALRRWCRFGSRATQRRRRRLIEVNPFCWLATRDRVPMVLAWVVVLVW